jgi:hypothetical protein
MVVQLTPAMREAMENCEQAAQRVTSMEVKMCKLSQSGITQFMQLEYDEACRTWRIARERWERIYIAAGGRL